MVLFQTTSCAATATSSTVAEGPAAPARAMHPPSRSLAALLPATALALLAFLPATTAFVVPGWPGRKAAPLLHCPAAPTATPTTTFLGLFSLNFNGGGGGDGDDGQEELSDWVRALLRLPDAETDGSDGNTAGEDGKDAPSSSSSKTKKKEKLPIPLASLLNVEALVAASGGTADEIADKDSVGRRESDPMEFILPKMEEQGDWTKLFSSLQDSVLRRSISDGEVLSFAAENILKEATTTMEGFLNETASVIPPAAVELLVLRASRTLKLGESGIDNGSGSGPGDIFSAADSFMRVAEDLAREQGLDVTEAADIARQTTQQTAELVAMASGLLEAGYVQGTPPSANARDTKLASATAAAAAAAQSANARPLFHKFRTVRHVRADDYSHVIKKSATMASLSGAIYQELLKNAHKVGHAVVANGITADVAWMVTDSVGFEEDYRKVQPASDVPPGERLEPILVRTVTLRGFDASDESVDRERLLNKIVGARKSPLGDPAVMVHKGLLEIAEVIYDDVVPLIDLAAPTHKVVLNGHSVGGSLSVLLLFLLAQRKGVDYVTNNILRVYTFGAPPVAYANNEGRPPADDLSCPTLEAFGLPSDLVYQYVQPWDPVVRLFSEIDPCYPLLEDIGEDGVTLYASGPSRALRPITRAIIESWEGWPRFRDAFRSSQQDFSGVGIQHLLLPEPTRYLADRFVGANIAIPPLYSVVQLSSRELMPALKETFPLDEFSISFVPAALRSFVHHFYPAYGDSFVEYANDRKRISDLEIKGSSVTNDSLLEVKAENGQNVFEWALGRTNTAN